MRRLRLLISLAAAAILISTVIAAPVPASAAGETMTLGSSIGSIYQEITVSGTGYDPGTPPDRYINIIFGKYPGPSTIDYSTDLHQIVKQEPINVDGTFSTTFAVPDMLETGNGNFEQVRDGTYYVFLTYHIPPSNDTQTILQIASFRVLAGQITMTPSTGPAGTEVILSGSDFGPSEQLAVKCDQEVLTVLQGGTTDGAGTFSNMKFFIPSTPAGAHAIVVTGMSSGHQAGRVFTTVPALVIKPDPGAASSSITIAGNGFAAGVNINVTYDNTSVYSNVTELNGSFVASFPPNTFHEGTHLVTATDSEGNAVQVNYKIFDAAVTLEPSSGSPGSEVTISGAGFKPDKKVTISFEGFGSDLNKSATSDEDGSFTTVFTVPWGDMGKWDVEVTDGDNTKTTVFEVNTSRNIDPITNTSYPGQVGEEITVSGKDFIAGRTVTVTFSGTQVATGTVQNNGTFSLVFNAPSAGGGSHIIEATDGTNTIRYGFVMESVPPPKPATLLPETGTKAGSETYFEWEPVTDPSGVTYTLQVATDSSFSYMVLEETGIQESEYTIPKQSRLNAVAPEAPYYWRVRAVDRAYNQGEWSDPATFSVGFGMSLPQSVIYIIIVGAALLLSAFTFWLGRRTAYY
jgi:hypothetical protein